MSAPAARVDLRLLPSAAAAWTAAAAVVLLPAPRLRLAAVGALVLLGVLAAVAAAVARGRLPRAVLPSAGLAVLVAVAVLGAGATQRAAVASPALVRAAEAGAVVDVVGRVVAPPRVLGAGGAAPTRVLVAVTADVRLAASGALLAGRVPVEVLVPGDVLDGAATRGRLEVDARVAVRGRATPRPPGERAAVAVAARAAPVVRDPPRPWFAWSSVARAHARGLGAALPGDAGALLPGVTVGDTAGIPVDLRDAMRTAGLAHLTAVSGAHFALLGALALAGTAALGAPRVVRVAAVAAVGLALVLVVGPEPSVVRAAVMGGVGLVALLAGRRPVGPAALCTAVVVLLLHDPWLAVAPGFALSVAATAGLVALGPPLVERWSPRWGRGAAGVLAAPVAAQVGCLPVVLALWPSLGAWAVPANLLTAPVVAPATVVGLAAVALAGWWPAGAGALAAVAGAACWWMGAVARACAALPGATLAWLPGPIGAAAAVLAAGCAAVLLVRRRPRR